MSECCKNRLVLKRLFFQTECLKQNQKGEHSEKRHEVQRKNQEGNHWPENDCVSSSIYQKPKLKSFCPFVSMLINLESINRRTH